MYFAPAYMKHTISDNLRELRGRIAEACEEFDRDADEITIVAVTKTFPADIIKKSVSAGLYDIGESKIQEAELKINAVGHIARYHLIGHLQSNKIKKAVQLFDVIQSVDSLELAKEISRRAGEAERVMECYIEVNSSGEPQKYGIAPDRTLELVKHVIELPHIKLSGLMTVGPLSNDQDAVRDAFRSVHELFHLAQEIGGEQFDVLSMGMSDDFQLAIAEGSTMIRVGTGIFGPRGAQDKSQSDSE